MKELFGYAVVAPDGRIGKVTDFLFDEQTHDIRYMVADTGGWLDRHPVLVAPVAFGRLRWPARDFPVTISREQVRNSPAPLPGTPLSRQHEQDLHSHYEWLPYWFGHSHPAVRATVPGAVGHERPLCRAREVLGYRLRATDSAFGHVADFVIDESRWRLQSMVVDTEHWWEPDLVMVEMAAFHGLDGAEHQALVGLGERQIRESPRYRPSAIASRENETVLYDYRGRPRL
jgi:hypothetical protein